MHSSMEFMICFDLYSRCSTGNMLYVQLKLLFEDTCENGYEDDYTENLVENLNLSKNSYERITTCT